MINPLSNLKLDQWYHIAMVVGLGVFIATAVGALKVLPATATLLISLGVFLIGWGEFINHPHRVGFVPGWQIETTSRSPGCLGLFLDLIGCALIIVGVWKLLF